MMEIIRNFLQLGRCWWGFFWTREGGRTGGIGVGEKESGGQTERECECEWAGGAGVRGLYVRLSLFD